jgi:hypothetical protein
MIRYRFVASTTLLLTVAGACRDSASPPDKFNAAVSMAVVSGGDQEALEYTELPQPVVVQILNAKGKPAPGQVVNFRVVQGGGSVFAGAAVTDANGIAREWWTIGGHIGRNLLEARAVDPSTGAQLVLGTVLAFPQELINPIVQFKCNNQADWTPPNSGPLPRECYGTSGDFPPRFENGEVVRIQVRVVHNGNVPVPRMWLDFFAFHNDDQGTFPSVTPVYGVTNALGITSAEFTIGSRLVQNELQVIGPNGIIGVQPFRAGYGAP